MSNSIFNHARQPLFVSKESKGFNSRASPQFAMYSYHICFPFFAADLLQVYVNRRRLTLFSKFAYFRFLIVIDDVAADELYNVVSAFPWTDGIGSTIILTTNIQSAGTRCICGKGLALAQCSSTSQFFKILELTESKFEEGYTLRAKLEEMLVSNYESLAGLGLQDLLLYFCMFPCDHPVRRNPLIRRWLAEEIVFIEPEDARSSPEEVAFNTLINRNIIQPVQVSNTGKVKRCRPYEIMLEIMLDSVSHKKSASNNFITLVCGRTGQEPSCVRRLSLHPSRAAANRRLKLPKDLSRLRTLAVFPAANLDNYKDTLKFAKYELLRVLDLKECSHLEEKHLRDICGLLLLKYLSLGETIGKVPQKIRNLQRLETLDMRRTKTVELCLEALQLPKLKHLLGKFQLQEIPNKKLDKFLSDNCDHLVLETLSGFVAERSQGISQQMLFMGQLKKVKIWLDSTVDATSITHLSDAVKMFTSDGNSMASVDRSLSIDFTECSTADCSVRFLESLQAPGKLTSLKLRGDLTQFLDSLPEPEKFVTKLRGIQELCLSSTNLAGGAILAGLVNLRVLKYLKLVEDNLGPLVIQAEHFPCLHRMCLVGVRSLHDVTIQAGALRSLVSLVRYKCSANLLIFQASKSNAFKI